MGGGRKAFMMTFKLLTFLRASFMGAPVGWEKNVGNVFSGHSRSEERKQMMESL